MGLMDKVKQGAGQALNKAQQGVSQGKSKIDQAQAKHQWDGLLAKLGAAVWAEKRQDGPSEAVAAAMAALDQHLATHGPVQADTGPGTTPTAEDGFEASSDGDASEEADEGVEADGSGADGSGAAKAEEAGTTEG
jgi:hypothetical protein